MISKVNALCLRCVKKCKQNGSAKIVKCFYSPKKSKSATSQAQQNSPDKQGNELFED